MRMVVLAALSGAQPRRTRSPGVVGFCPDGAEYWPESGFGTDMTEMECLTLVICPTVAA
jgi:hypothetical protein